ncbi:MAG: TetR family transcriptional regulator [Alphaproteobacteria bacterium]
MGRRSIEDVRRAELVEAALLVIAQEGHDAATTQRIAAQAETSPGIVHHYFGDKASLQQAAFRAVRKPVAQAYRKLLAEAGDPEGTGWDALNVVVDAHLEPRVLTIPTAAVWLQFTSRVAYRQDYARIAAAVRCRQVAALRRALLCRTATVEEASARARVIASVLDGIWYETATREGGLAPAEAKAMAAPHLSL